MNTPTRLLGWIVLLLTSHVSAGSIAIETVLSDLPIHAQGDQNVFSTPFDYRNGMVFTVHVEPGNGNGREGVNLHTVVRKGTRLADASWIWESHVVEPRTMLDTWHTQGSIALDKDGYVHVAYNMHNLPWQYAVSDKPYDISSFTFKGQVISLAEIERAKFENKTSFPDIGTAAIPGNQISYPVFYKDRQDELYVSYRFAVQPAREWEHRAFGAGIAHYVSETQKWVSVGGEVALNASNAKPQLGKGATNQRPFAYEDGYTVYLPALGFDASNKMHVAWSWRLGEAGTETVRPSYAVSSDGIHFSDVNGNPTPLPVNYSHSPPIEGRPTDNQFYAEKAIAFSLKGEPMVLMQPLGVGRQIWTLHAGKQHFEKEESPFAASALIVDKQGRQWAFATGLRVFMRTDGSNKWDDMGTIGTNVCAPKVAYYPTESRFVIHAKSCDNSMAKIFTFRR